MTDSDPVNRCPDCGGELMDIKLFGRSWKNPLSGGAIDTEMTFYAPADAQRTYFKSMYEETGTVRTTMCKECHRIFLHGVPKGE